MKPRRTARSRWRSPSYRPISQIEPLEQRQLLSCTINVQLADGTKSATVTVGEVLQLQVFATISGNDAGSTDGLQDVVGSFIGTPANASTSVIGDLAAQLVSPFDSYGVASPGTSQDLNGDGGKDVGGTNPDTTDGYFYARSDSMTTTGGTLGTNSQTFEIGTLTYTVQTLNDGQPTDINFVPDASLDFNYAVWQQDGTGENNFTSTFAVGAPVVVSAPGVAPSGSISGSIDSSSDAPIAGVTVYIDANNNDQLDSGETSTTTNANGAYSFAGLAAGDYIVRQVLPSGDTQTTPSGGLGHHVTLSSGQSVSGENFTDTVPATGASISGTVTVGSSAGAGITVYLDNNNNGKLDSGEPSTTTNANGAYSFTGLAAGAYIVRQVLPSGDTQTSPSGGLGHHVTVSAGQSVTGENFTNTAPASGATISGTITVNSSPAAGITVYIDTNNNGKLDSGESSTTTNSAGAYSFTGLAAGTYIIRQVLPSGDTQTSPSGGLGHHVTVSAGQSVTGENFTDTASASTATITGTVFDDANGDGQLDDGETGIANIEVYIDENNTGAFASGDPETTTNASGVYTFANLAAGTYILRVILPSGYTQTYPTNNLGHHTTVAAGQTQSGEQFGLHK